MASNPQPLLCPTFHSFGRLPPELRYRIFEFALPCPFSIPIIRVEGLQADNGLGCTAYHFRLRTSSRFLRDVGATKSHQILRSFTGLLRACRESREIVIKKFNHAIPTKKGGIIRIHESTMLYIDSFTHYDIADWVPKPRWPNMEDYSISKLKKIALPLMLLLTRVPMSQRVCPDFLPAFQNLETLVFVSPMLGDEHTCPNRIGFLRQMESRVADVEDMIREHSVAAERSDGAKIKVPLTWLMV